MSEEYVTEYDIDHQETIQGYANPNLGKMNILTGWPRERIIRCRDCRHYGSDRSIAGAGLAECRFFNRMVPEPGFCAWAEPREGGGMSDTS